MSLAEEYISSIVSKVAEKSNLKRWQYSVEKFENIGQNYFGIIIPVTLSGEDHTSDCIIKIVLKLAPTDERFRVSGAVTTMFRREIFVYSMLLEKYRNYKVSYFAIPTLYFARDEYCKEVIAMEDMCYKGYMPYTQEAFLDLDHVTVALMTLARLHAFSFVLKKFDSKLYDEVTKVCIPLTEDTNKRYMEIMKDRLTKASCKFEGSKYVPLLADLKDNCGGIFNKAIELARGTCICHGDVWKENILFSYKDNKPYNACLIDYQTTRLSSPAFDTLYLIISSTDSHLRQRCYYNLLNIYFETFYNTLEDNDVESHVYSREMFDDDLKVVAPACLITANTALWLANGLQEEGHVRSKHIWTTKEEKDRAVNKYKSAIRDIIDEFYIYGYLLEEIIKL